MRRMITETDVEKLDSIQPSEIEKLGKITNADIESVQAMQSPKNAKAGYVLTAVSGGTAQYKPAAGGTKINRYWTSGLQMTADQLKTNGRFPGYKVYYDDGPRSDVTFAYSISYFPRYTDSAGQKVYIKPTDYIIGQSDVGGMFVGITEAAYNKFVADTTGIADAKIDFGIQYIEQFPKN